MTDEFFTKAYNTYKNTVYSVVYNYVKNADDASELTQEAFIRMYTTSEEYSSDEHLKAWLIRVSINLCKNHLRSRKHISDSPIPDDLPAEEGAEHDDLLPIVMSLPEKYRIPIHLFYYEDFSLKQIADVLDIPEATVKTRLKRGRDKLQKLLRREDWNI